jgi:hypothetical protein
MPVLAAAADPPRYFASAGGGLYGAGTVSRFDGYERRVVYDFCPDWPTCRDGAAPLPTLVELADGSLIGVTSAGGDSIYGRGGGVIFKLTPLTDGTWEERTLVYICLYWQQCTRFGTPSGIVFEAPDFIYGVSETDDGAKGAFWRYKYSEVGTEGVLRTLKFWGHAGK